MAHGVLPSFESLVLQLIDCWCERRALKPLRWVLSAWPHNGLTDGISDLLEALRTARALGKAEIAPPEEDMLNQAIAEITKALDQR